MNRLDLIIDALESIYYTKDTSIIQNALTAARELKSLEPVAWMQDSLELYVNDRFTSTYTIPLYTAPPKPEQDWSLLKATQESLREHQARIKELEAQLAQPEQKFKYTHYGLRSDENGKLSIGEISQREWVGLTNEERNEMIGKIQHDRFTRQRDLIGKTQIITEMYLKELNT